MSEYGMLNALMTPGLTQTERNVYAYLVGRANGARVCWPLIADIAAHLGAADRTVMAATKRLVALGRLEVTRRYKDTNNYRIVEVPGLYDRPIYGPASPPPVVNGTHTIHADLQKTAPQTQPQSDLQKTAPQSPVPDLQKTAPETVSPAENDILGCKIPHSDLQKTASHPLEQVRAIKEEKEQASGARMRAPARTTIPPDWKPDAKQERHAINLSLGPDPVARRFVLWHRRKGTLSPDWAAEWEWWCDNEVQRVAEQNNDHRGNGMVKIIAQEGWVSARRNGHDREVDGGAKVIEGMFGHA